MPRATGRVWGAWGACHCASLLLLLCAAPPAAGDVFLTNPMGSNNKLFERSNAVQNDARLFNSQNNARGGFQVGDTCEPSCRTGGTDADYIEDMVGAGDGHLKLYESSLLRIEWTAQHGCGGPDVNCQFVLQYMCSEELRDGRTTATIPESRDSIDNPFYGMHEPFDYFQKCGKRERNKGLYTADQTISDTAGAQATRQNINGARRGFECQEERDYYPYWHPTPWKDIAVLADDVTLCPYYQAESENVKGRGECIPTNITALDAGALPNSREGCFLAGFRWVESQSHNLTAPNCTKSPYLRANHLGDVGARFDWVVPKGLEGLQCAIRLRYNVSSRDSENFFDLDMASNGNMEEWGTDNLCKDFVGFTKMKMDNMGDLPDHMLRGNEALKLATNTNQLGRTFQDRTHRFITQRRPAGIQNAAIHNVNIRGRRGNLQQTFPAVEYDFVPTNLTVKQGEFIHFQWVDSDAATQGNTGAGLPGSGKSNLVYSKGGNPGSTVPASHSDGVNPLFSQRVSEARAVRTPFSASGNASSGGGGASAVVQGGVFSGEDDFESDVEAVAFFAHLSQEGCEYDPQRIDLQDDSDVRNCAVLNRAPSSVDGGLVRMNIPGTHPFLSTRNNDFSNRGQKGVVVVTKDPPLGPSDVSEENRKSEVRAVVVIVTLTVVTLCIAAFYTVGTVARRNPHKSWAQQRWVKKIHKVPDLPQLIPEGTLSFTIQSCAMAAVPEGNSAGTSMSPSLPPLSSPPGGLKVTRTALFPSTGEVLLGGQPNLNTSLLGSTTPMAAASSSRPASPTFGSFSAYGAAGGAITTSKLLGHTASSPQGGGGSLADSGFGSFGSPVLAPAAPGPAPTPAASSSSKAQGAPSSLPAPPGSTFNRVKFCADLSHAMGLPARESTDILSVERDGSGNFKVQTCFSYRVPDPGLVAYSCIEVGAEKLLPLGWTVLDITEVKSEPILPESQKRASRNWRSIQLVIVCMAVLMAWGALAHRHWFIRHGNPWFPLAKTGGVPLNFMLVLLPLPTMKMWLGALRDTPADEYIDLDSSIEFHKLVSKCVLFLMIIHISGHALDAEWFNIRHCPKPYCFDKKLCQCVPGFWGMSYGEQLRTIPGWTGVVITIFFTVIFFNATPMRRKANTDTRKICPLTCCKVGAREYGGWDRFWYTHHLWIPTYLLLLLHAPRFYCWCAVPLLMFALEKACSYWRLCQPAHIQSITLVSKEVIQLTVFKQGFRHLCGQYVKVLIPELSHFVSHPFTVSSAPERDIFSVHMRTGRGMDWTSGLRDAFFKRELREGTGFPIKKSFSPANPCHWTVAVDGPFATSTQQYIDYQTVLLIGAGIGVTPFASILKAVLEKKSNMVPDKVYFYWIANDEDHFNWFGDLMSDVREFDKDRVEITTYMTGDFDLEAFRQRQIAAESAGSDQGAAKFTAQRTGKPNWRRILPKLAEKHKPEDGLTRNSIGVFFCGPLELGITIASLCDSQSTRNVKFDFHKEVF